MPYWGFVLIVGWLVSQLAVWILTTRDRRRALRANTALIAALREREQEWHVWWGHVSGMAEAYGLSLPLPPGADAGTSTADALPK
jgi:hypothetical protein